MTDLMEYIINDLECSSVFGRKKIKSITFLKDEEKIQKELDNTEIIINFLKENPEKISKIKETLMHFKDIYRTLKKASIENIFDDIELFEIKHFCIFSEKLREEIKKELETFSPQKLENIVTLLDPEGLKINSFYVYSAYSEKLKNIREMKKKIKLQ